MKKSLFLFAINFLFLPLFAQYQIQLQVDSMPSQRAFLFEFRGTKTLMVDSTRTRVPGLVEFSLKQDAHPGLYRIVVGPNTWQDFIFNNENIKLRNHYGAMMDSLKVIQSKENSLLREYMEYFLILNRKQEYLSALKNLYQPESSFYQSIQVELSNLAKDDPELVIDRIIKDYPDTYVAGYLMAQKSPRIPNVIKPEEELNYVLSNFFEAIDFTRGDLIYSPPLTNRVRSYFGLIQQAFPPQEVEQELVKGLDRLMSLAAVNDVVFNFLLEDIAEGFERSEFESFYAYLTENYLLEAACQDESRSQELSDLLTSIQKTAIGNDAPEIILPLASGPVILSEIKEPYVMVLFWASWCPHCSEVLPQIKEVYQQYHSKGFEIVAISLDEEAAKYEAALKNGDFPWINYSELKGWDCSIAYDYGIRSTPTMVLIGPDHKIVAKPRNVEMLIASLRELGF